MKAPVPRRMATTALAAALMVSAFAAQPVRSQASFAEDNIRRMVDGLRSGTLSVSTAADECRRAMEAERDAQTIREVFHAFLEVPKSHSLAAFCRALALAIKDGKLTAEGLTRVDGDIDDHAKALETGRLFRAVFFSHIVTTTASAEGQGLQ